MNMRTRQEGSLLLEALIVLLVIAGLAYVAVPGFSDTLLRGDMENARASVVQSLQEAKTIARARSTFVEVSFHDNQLRLRSSDGGAERQVALPSRVQVSEASAFSFTPQGVLIDVAGNQVESSTIVITPADKPDSPLAETVIISSTGNIMLGEL